jgi:Tfp pilus assembly protein PilF
MAESPQHAQALLLEANLALTESRYAEARDLVRRSLAIDPLREGAHLRLAVVALEEGSAREALREVKLERAIADPSARQDVVAGRAWAPARRSRQSARRLPPRAEA